MFFAPSVVEVELAVGPDPGPGAGCQVGCAVGVEGGRRVAAASCRSGHVGSDHGGGEGTRIQSGSDLATTYWSHFYCLVTRSLSGRLLGLLGLLVGPQMSVYYEHTIITLIVGLMCVLLNRASLSA